MTSTLVNTASSLLPCEAGEVARLKAVTEGACGAQAPSTTLRAVPLPRSAGEEKRPKT